ncbi:MAG: hypothetical protein JWR69_1118 [Pedosphaera sp.]|nr:hypothetical protein [Pedosphaera sp.]
MNRAVTLGLLLATALALVFRCPDLGNRPMHNDEAVNAIKFRSLWEQGAYKYDPDEHHGPTLLYLTQAWAKLSRGPDFARYSEARLRFLTVLFGVGLILLLPLVVDGLGRRATICAALLTAISPGMVFYSRYYIHEMLLVFFTFLAIIAGWRYTRSRKIGWALLCGAAIGLMQATKETFVLPLAAMAAALILNQLWTRWMDARSAGVQLAIKPRHAAAALGVWLVVAFLLFSSFFTNAAGPLDAIRTYLPWLHRAAGASPHIHPWHFYLSRLAFFHTQGGPIWSEGLILGLALVGGLAAFARKLPPDSNAGFIRFLAFYTLILTVIYSAIAYKTPWCLLGFWHGMILLAGVGAVAIIQWLPQRGLKLAATLLLLAGAGQLAGQAWSASFKYCADPRNPYVYAQTSSNFLELVTQLDALAAVKSPGRQTVVKVMSPGSDFWPLPWYLRQFDHVGWWGEMPADPFAPVMIVSTKFNASLETKKTHVMVGLFKLRPDAFLELYVELDLWRAYLESRPKPPEPVP